MKRALRHKNFWRAEHAKTAKSSRENLRTKQSVLICLMEELHIVRRCSMKTLRKDLVVTMRERLDLKLEQNPIRNICPRGPVRAVGTNVRQVDFTVLKRNCLRYNEV